MRCDDKTYYTGVTTNLEQRLKVHTLGKGARYTSGRLPVKLVYSQNDLTENKAKKMEIALKSLSREAKEKIISGEVPEWLKGTVC